MAQFVLPGLVLVVALLFTPQLVAAQWASILRGFNTKAFMRGFKTGLEIGDYLFGGGSDGDGDEENSITVTYSSTPSGLEAPLKWTDGMGYVVELGINSMPSAFLVATANNFVWTDGCALFPTSAMASAACTSEQCGQFNTMCDANSRCRYQTPEMRGYLADSKFTFNDSKPLNLSFGCSDMTSNYSMGYNRVAGLGRGPLSLISQLQVSNFSYCFTDYGIPYISSRMFFGSYTGFDHGLKDFKNLSSSDIATTPFQLCANYYCVKLIGMSVGDTAVAFPTTRLLIDSSSPLTYLESAVYSGLRSALVSHISASGAKLRNAPPYDLCFDQPSNATRLDMPHLTFNLEGADMKLPTKNYLFPFVDVGNRNVTCLAMMPKTSADGHVNYSILGNFQQQNIEFLYDLQKGTLSFKNFPCYLIPPWIISHGDGVKLSGGVQAALLPLFFFFYYLFVPFPGII